MLSRVRLGRTGLDASILGFGGIPIMKVDQDTARSAIQAAVCHGINIIDTARGYGDSESKIGNALQGVSTKPIIASKSSKRDALGMRLDFFKSLEELKLDRIDIYQLHCVNRQEEYESAIGQGGAYEELLKLKDQGLVDFIGLTSHNLSILEKAIESKLFDTIQIIFNLLEPQRACQVIDYALENDIGVLVMKPLGGGIIENNRLGISYVLAKKGVVALVGMSTADEVISNLEVASQATDLSEEDWAQIESIRRNAGSVYCRRCEYCQPCHQSIPISFALQVPSIRKRIGDGLMRSQEYRLLLQKMVNCDQCGDCESRCPFGLPIRKLLQESRLLLEGILGLEG